MRNLDTVRSVLQGLSVCILLVGRSAAQDAPDFLSAIEDEAEFEALSAASPFAGEVERTTKFLLPGADEPALLGPVFQNVNRYPFHREFMVGVFPERFPALTEDGYRALVERRASRRYFAGSVSRLQTAQGTLYGFSVFFDFADAAEILTVDEVGQVYTALSGVFALVPLVYAPDNVQARLAAEGWQDPGFPVYLGGAGDGGYQAYTLGVGYGRVRLHSPESFEEANSAGRITWQDIVILEQAPRDIEGVVGGVITAERQGPLSHVAIRTARRGTPNAYLEDALDAFRPHDGQLVRLEVGAVGYEVEIATLEEAGEWWDANRPSLSAPVSVDRDYSELDRLIEMDLETEVPPEARFGGKATNAGRLQRLLDGAFAPYREVGFAIPLHHYFEFMRSNTISESGRELTYEEHLQELMLDPGFQSDPERRFKALGEFRRRARDEGAVSDELEARIAERIEAVFGSRDLTVRFRSSSNVEDALEFNGAGLYESTSVCVLDSFDEDGDGPSLCNPDQPEERKIKRALKKVWTSLWTFRAFEERSWYQIPPDDVGMGILVTRAFLDEAANGVAFTGNPANSLDRRYVVVAQAGEESVVSPEPGVIAETNVLEIDGDQVSHIDRAQASNRVGAGERVLADASLRELGMLLAYLDRAFPVELGAHAREDVLLDVEFKLERDGTLAVKQIRPFLLAAEAPPGPTFTLRVPEDFTACGIFVDGRPPRGELDVKSRVRFARGPHELPTTRTVFTGDLFEEVLFGPSMARAEPVGPGRYRLTVTTPGDGSATYVFSYEQSLRLPGGEVLEITLNLPPFESDGQDPVETEKTFGDEFLIGSAGMTGVPGGDRNRIIHYSSCALDSLPLWDVRATLADGTTLRLEERFQIPLAGSAPANVVAATVTAGGAERRVEDYWQLVYAAQHHNVHVEYWIVLDPPLEIAGAGSVYAIEIKEPRRDAGRPAAARYLDAGFQTLASPAVASYWKGLFGEDPPGFYRGDANSSSSVNLTDAVFIIDGLFDGGAAPPCPDAADFDDDGSVEITDVILILSYLFRGVDLAFPPGPETCGADPTEDFLGPCEAFCQ